MKRFMFASVLIAITIAISAPSSQAAYLYLSECRSALHGNPGDNEVAQERTHLNQTGWVLTDEWHWSSYSRLSDNRIIQFVNYVQYNGLIVTGRMFCYDDNKSGQIAISEDWYG